MSEVRALLERAAQEAGPPRGTVETVYLRAARVRRRRWAAGCAAALAVAGLAGLVPQLRDHGEKALPGTGKELSASERAERVERLLPPGLDVRKGPPSEGTTGVGSVYPVPFPGGGPLDGTFTVRDGGPGEATVRLWAHPASTAGEFGGLWSNTPSCHYAGKMYKPSCEKWAVPGVGEVVSYRPRRNPLPHHPPYLWAVELWRKDGRLVMATVASKRDDIVSVSELRKVVLRTEVLPPQ
ncbi:hypothetical protein [Streptomyces sp. CAU 1734]|uniref:hypothetical protein n=1 Tax=Streptomyces sp. CAU 1734 TaxID=3140360 RepID=UPI0032606AAE